MKRVFRLTLSILLLAALAGYAVAADGVDNRLNIADFATCPEAFEGRRVEVSAEVIAINADSKSLELFDSQSRMLIGVRLTQLRKTDRTALMLTGVRRVVVSGRATVVGGRLVINAQRVEALPLRTSASGRTSTEAGTAGAR